MRIGLDVTPLPRNPVGAGTYIIQLARAISALPTSHRWVIFAQPHQRKLIGDLINVEWVIVPQKSPAERLVWEQTRLPGLVRQFGLQLLHSLHYTRPIRLSCASVVTFHDMTFFLYPELHSLSKRLFFPIMIRFSARRSNRIISVSENTRRDAIRLLKIPPEKVVVISPGISQIFCPINNAMQLQQCRDQYQLPERFILFVGLIEPRKNLSLLIRAYSQHAGEPGFPDLVLVGRPGWMYQEVFNLVKEFQLEQKIHFTGYVPAEDLPMIYNLAEVFVYPSIYEGFGFPPLEAMACGTPVITTGTSAMLETVAEAGLHFPSQDERALSDSIQLLISDPALREKYSVLGRQRAAQFSWRRTAEETLRVYEQAVK